MWQLFQYSTNAHRFIKTKQLYHTNTVSNTDKIHKVFAKQFSKHMANKPSGESPLGIAAEKQISVCHLSYTHNKQTVQHHILKFHVASKQGVKGEQLPNSGIFSNQFNMGYTNLATSEGTEA